MAAIYITEYSQAGVDSLKRATFAPLEPDLATQALTITGTSAASSAFNAKTAIVRIHTDTACHIKFGTSPTAVNASTTKLAANQTEYFAVPRGESYKIAGITAS